MSLVESTLASIPGQPLTALRRSDALWKALREQSLPLPTVVSEQGQPLTPIDWDVVICGGTLGILLGAALTQRGWRVVLIERGTLRGRDQEWNISRSELQTFLDLGLLSPEELERAIAMEFNPVRVSFQGGSDIWVEDVLNLGVDPVFLLETLKQRFLAQGGQLIEQTAFTGVKVHPNGVTVQVKPIAPTQSPTPTELRGRLLLDAMGHFSPIVQQARQNRSPDSVCLVVGTCATGYPDNQTADLMVSFTPIQRHCQYFWEAFPARQGRTTYLFTYVDAHPDRPSLEELFADYLQLLPTYQGVAIEQLQFQRALFGFFPGYRQSPLQLPWQRILPIGDSSGSQSPLSFGGFGAMVRHLDRLTKGITAALHNDSLGGKSLHQPCLGLLQPYQPSLAVTWLFQRAMSVGIDQSWQPEQINHLLTIVFADMEQAGPQVLKPFLQDVVRFGPLSQTLLKTGITHPELIARLLPQLGLPTLLHWMRHYGNLAAYTALSKLWTQTNPWLQPWLQKLPTSQQHRLYCQTQAWHYGSGNDQAGSSTAFP